MLPLRLSDFSREVKNPLLLELWLVFSPFIRVEFELSLVFEAILLLIDSILACLSPTFLRKASTSTHSSTNFNSHSAGTYFIELLVAARVSARFRVFLYP